MPNIKQYVFFIALVVFSTISNAEVITYGKIHMSADTVDVGNSDGKGVSSNASRIGFKGKGDLSYGLKAIWKIETELDVTNDVTSFKARNRYFGLNRGNSTLIAGFHDTPFKTLGAKVAVMQNTIADRRGVLGRDFLNDKALDVRAKNAVMFINRSISSTELRIMRSAGSKNNMTGDKLPITSMSALYKNSFLMLGAAFEENKSQKITGYRFLTGISFSTIQIKAIIEKIEFEGSSANKAWDRKVTGISFVHKRDETSIKAHAFFAQDLNRVSGSDGQMYALGIYHDLAKFFEVYGVVAKIKNGQNAAYTLAGFGHGDRYRPSSNGVRMHAVSFGGIYKF